jgi:hypothetical protein
VIRSFYALISKIVQGKNGCLLFNIFLFYVDMIILYGVLVVPIFRLIIFARCFLLSQGGVGSPVNFMRTLIRFDENPSSASRVVSCRQTDGRTDRLEDLIELIAVFRNFE